MNYTILKENDSGSDVILLQQLLKINGYNPSSITGSFGPDTTLYVKNFQRDNNLTIDGIVGIDTWNKLYDLTSPITFTVLDKKTIKEGDTGEEVSEVQTILKQMMYYDGEINGIFDKTLKTSVQTYQFINKLIPSGEVDTNTWSALIKQYSPLSNCEDIEQPVIPDTSTYTVVTGDTLYGIANKFNTTVEAIKFANNLTSNTLSIGQVLKIPGSIDTPDTEQPDVPTSTYTVKAGDSLYRIATTFNTTVDELKRLNNLTSDSLSIGQVLKVPGSTDTEEPDVPTSTYTVKVGDTLYSLASKFNTTVDLIKSLNNLTSNLLSIGQILKVPSPTDTEQPDVPNSTYTVKVGDTLYSLASKFNTTVDLIKSLNNLTSNLLSIGQVLKIPGVSEETLYTVKAGDTLYSIAKKYNTTITEIKDKNNLNSDTLSIGQVLKI